MSKITTDFAGTETQAVTVSRLTSILSAYGKVPSAYTTWGNARTDLNDLLSSAGQTAIGNFEVAGTFRPKLNWLNDLNNFVIAMFRSGEAGALYDPSDLSTLFQDAAGSTAVTAVEQPVGRMLDKSGRGNHATQSTSAARPTLRARYNLLERTEEFDNAYWSKSGATITANAAVAPNGTTTADALTEDTANAIHRVQISSTSFTTGAVYTFSVYVQRVGARRVYLNADAFLGVRALFDLTGSGSVVNLAGSAANRAASITVAGAYYRCTVTGTGGATSPNAMFVQINRDTSTTAVDDTYTGDGTSGIYIWGAQLLTAADQTATGGAYQRVAAATDYDTSNPVWRPYLAFDGTDDSMSTASVDFTGTDEMTVFAGVTKLSDAAVAIVAELGTTLPTGGIYLAAPANVASDFAYASRGSGAGKAAVYTNAAVAAPSTNVLTGTSDISAPAVALRVDGAQVVSDLSTQGSGNYGNYPLFIGRRNNASLPFNGRIYSMIVLGRTATAAEIAATEAWLNARTGAY